MVPLSSLFNASRGHRFIQKLTPFLLAGMILVVLSGCDTMNLDASENGPRDDETKIQISDKPFEGADLKYDPVSLAPGETFSISLSDARHDQPVTRILHEGLPGGKKAIRASFAPLQPSSVTVRCRNVTAGTAQTMAELDADKLGPGNGVQTMAKTDDDPDSYHYTEDEGGTVVSVDYDEEKSTAPTFDFPSTDAPVQCTHVSFVLHGMDTELSPTGVQFGGDVPAPTLRRQEVQRIKK